MFLMEAVVVEDVKKSLFPQKKFLSTTDCPCLPHRSPYRESLPFAPGDLSGERATC